MLDIRSVSFAIGNKKILDDISIGFEPGLLHVIVGPNGSGKSSFLKIFSGECKPGSGVVYYDGQDISGMNKTLLAQRRSVMSQLPELYFPLSVDEVVMMGRYPHFDYRPSAKDERICKAVMEKTGSSVFADRDYLTLSGGEKQRVQFARALAQIWEGPAQGHRYLFLDEPVSSLDIYYQHQFLQLFQSLKKEKIVLIAVLHDINLALQYADRIVFMKEGRIAHTGAVPDAVTASIIEEVFHIPVNLLKNPFGSAPVVVYRS